METPVLVADVSVAPILADFDHQLAGLIDGDIVAIPAEPWYDTNLPYSYPVPIIQEQSVILVDFNPELTGSAALVRDSELPTNPVTGANPIEPPPILVDFDPNAMKGLLNDDPELTWSISDAMTPLDQSDPILVDMNFKRIDWDDMTGIVLDPIVNAFLKVKYTSQSGVASEWSIPQRYRAFRSTLERK